MITVFFSDSWKYKDIAVIFSNTQDEMPIYFKSSFKTLDSDSSIDLKNIFWYLAS